MIERIYNNLDYTNSKTGLAKSTFYHWLNGAAIKTTHMAILQNLYNFTVDIYYVYRFTTLAKQLKETNELTKVAEILNTDNTLDQADRTLLADYHINRIYRTFNGTLTAEEVLNECR